MIIFDFSPSQTIAYSSEGAQHIAWRIAMINWAEDPGTG